MTDMHSALASFSYGLFLTTKLLTTFHIHHKVRKISMCLYTEGKEADTLYPAITKLVS